MGLLFGLENGKNTTYSHIKIGKMVHKDKKRAASGDTPINGTPIGSILTLILNVTPQKNSWRLDGAWGPELLTSLGLHSRPINQ